MRLKCEQCGDVMYRKPVVYKGVECCDAKCVENYIDSTILVCYGDPAQLQLPLEVGDEVPRVPKTQKGNTPFAAHSQNAFEMSKKGTW